MNKQASKKAANPAIHKTKCARKGGINPTLSK